MCRLLMIVLLCASNIAWAQHDSLQLCLTNLASDPEFLRISGKIPLGQVSSVSSSMLGDVSMANNKERE
ncbi:MAG: hypothetical protein ABJA83_16205, partial [Burkholderiaceae bacterium]